MIYKTLNFDLYMIIIINNNYFGSVIAEWFVTRKTKSV